MKKAYELFIVGIWMGMVLGISFIETPLKFQAPGMTTALGLGIGELVFGALNKIEIIFSCILAICLFIKRRQTAFKTKFILIVVFSVVFFQSAFLLPMLNDRAAIVISGGTIANSYHHGLFVFLEVLKLVLLCILFFRIHKASRNIYNR